MSFSPEPAPHAATSMLPEIRVSERAKKRLILFFICLGVVFAVFGVSLFGDFVFDDRHILDHQTLLSNLNLLRDVLALPYWTQAAGLYRPITLLSYALNFFFLGASPIGFHLVNLLLYASIGFLLYLLVNRLFKDRLTAYLAAIFFILLPIHTEVVANITGRSELLALFFSLLCFLELLKERKVKRVWNYWLAGVWLLFAIGSKETAIATLPLAALVVYLKERGALRRVGRRKEIAAKYAPAFAWLSASVLTYFSLRLMVLGMQYFLGVETSIVENPLKFTSLGPRIYTALEVLWLYVEKSFWPLTLCSDYSYNQLPVVHTFLNGYTILGGAVLVWLVVSLVIFLKRAPIIALGSAFFLFSFVPVANLLFPTGTIMGERLMFYPSIGISLYLAALFSFLLREKNREVVRRVSIAVLAALLVFYAARSLIRSVDWLTEERLFTSAAACAPNSVLSTSNLGATYYLNGDLIAAKKELELSRTIYDGYPKGINNLGLVYWKEGDVTQARILFLKALDAPFPYYGAYENLALLALEAGDRREAKKWLLMLYAGNATAADAYIQARGSIKAAR